MKAAEAGWRHVNPDIDGRRAFVRVSTGADEATPIVHVHGFEISGTNLLPMARLLTDRALNVVPDLPGCGRSQKPPRPLDMPHLADAVIKLLDALEIEQAVFVGDSIGCAIRHLVMDGVPGRRVDAACRGSRLRALRADGNASTRSRRRCPVR